MPSLFDEIEPLKQSALADMTSAPDMAALEYAKGNWIGAHGKFTALMKQLGSLPQDWLRRCRWTGGGGRISLLRRAQYTRRPSRARHAGHILFGGARWLSTI